MYGLSHFTSTIALMLYESIAVARLNFKNYLPILKPFSFI